MNSLVIKPVFFDTKDFRLTSEILFANENIIQIIEDLIWKQVFLRVLTDKHRKYNQLTDRQHRMWFGGIVNVILKHFKTQITPANIYALHYELKKRFFPCDYMNVGPDIAIPVVPSLREMTKEDMAEIIDRVMDHYRMLNIEFNTRRFEI